MHALLPRLSRGPSLQSRECTMDGDLDGVSNGDGDVDGKSDDDGADRKALVLSSNACP